MLRYMRTYLFLLLCWVCSTRCMSFMGMLDVLDVFGALCLWCALSDVCVVDMKCAFWPLSDGLMRVL